MADGLADHDRDQRVILVNNRQCIDGWGLPQLTSRDRAGAESEFRWGSGEKRPFGLGDTTGRDADRTAVRYSAKVRRSRPKQEVYRWRAMLSAARKFGHWSIA